jgi:hypothetical protein
VPDGSQEESNQEQSEEEGSRQEGRSEEEEVVLSPDRIHQKSF